MSAIQFIDGNESFRVICEYNNRSQIVEQRILFGGELTRKSSFDYNEFGDKIRETIEDDNGNRHQNDFAYEYQDPWRNWTRQIIYHLLGRDELRRRISYYDQ